MPRLPIAVIALVLDQMRKISLFPVLSGTNWKQGKEIHVT